MKHSSNKDDEFKDFYECYAYIDAGAYYVDEGNDAAGREEDIYEEEQAATTTATAVATIADLVESSSPLASCHGMNSNHILEAINKNNDVGAVGLEKLLLETLTEDQGLLLKQLLLLQEKAFEQKILLKEKNHEFKLMTEHKNHELMMEQQKHKLILERKEHELILERKNAENAKMQHELDLLKLQHTMENNSTAVKKKLMDCETFCTKMEEMKNQINEMNAPTSILERRLEQMEQKMEKKMEENITKKTNKTLIKCSELVEARLEQQETNEPERKMFVPEPLMFNPKTSNWQTFVASSWPKMTTGRHTWTIHFPGMTGRDKYPKFYAGLITVRDHLNYKKIYYGNVIGDGVPGWGYSNDGSLLHERKTQTQGFPNFSCGDRLTFVLDLGSNSKGKYVNNTKDGNDGSLHVSVNYGKQHLLASNLSSSAKSKGGFFPAVTIFRYFDTAYLCDYENISRK